MNNVCSLLRASVFLSVVTILGWLDQMFTMVFFQFYEPIDMYVSVCPMKEKAAGMKTKKNVLANMWKRPQTTKSVIGKWLMELGLYRFKR